MKKVTKILLIVLGCIHIATGIDCIFNPTVYYLRLGFSIGISMLLDAVGRFATYIDLRKHGEKDIWMLIGAVLSIIFGIFIITDTTAQYTVDLYIAYFTALWIMSIGFTVIFSSFKVHKLHKRVIEAPIKIAKNIGKRWWLLLILGILMVSFGILSILNPLVIMTSIGIFIGFGMISNGCDLIAVATTPIADPNALQEAKE